MCGATCKDSGLIGLCCVCAPCVFEVLQVKNGPEGYSCPTDWKTSGGGVELVTKGLLHPSLPL